MMNYYFSSRMMPGSFFGFGLILNIAFWVLFALLIAMLIRKFVGTNEKHEVEEEDDEDSLPALEILKKRYAKGEITKKEFVEMKKDIS